MKMYIPSLKTKLQLTKLWTFSLFCEERNKTLWDLKSGRSPLNMIPLMHRRGVMALIDLPKGTNLTIDRIFIRQGSEPFNSVTMRGEVEHFGNLYKVRFWVVLDDFNKMEATVTV